MENVAPGQQLADTRLPSMDCTRPSLEAFNALPSRPSSAAARQHQQQQRVQNAQVAADPQAAGREGLLSLCAMLGVQANMQQALARLAAVARDLPVPMRMLVTLLPHLCVAIWLCPGCKATANERMPSVEANSDHTTEPYVRV